MNYKSFIFLTYLILSILLQHNANAQNSLEKNTNSINHEQSGQLKNQANHTESNIIINRIELLENKLSKFEKDDSFKLVREWLSAFFGLIGMVLGVLGYIKARRSDKISSDLETQDILRQVFDILGGEENAVIVPKNSTANSNDMVKAKHLLTKAECLSPNSAKVNHIWALYYRAIGDTKKAKISEKKSQKIAPNRASSYLTLGNIFRDEGNLNKAIEYYQLAIEVEPEYWLAYINMAGLLSSLGDFVQAENLLDASIGAHKIYPDYHTVSARLYLNSGRLEDSLRAIKKALNEKNSDPSIKRLYAVVLAHLGNITEAKSQLNELVKINHNDADSLLDMGVIYLIAKENEKALEYFDKVIELNPNYALAYLNKGNIYFERKEYEIAIMQYKKAISNDPCLVTARLRLGDIYDRQNLHDLAVSAYEETISTFNNHIGAKLKLARIKLNRNQHDEAMEIYCNILKIESENLDALFGFAYCNNALKNTGVAIETYREFIKLKPDDVNAINNLGVIMFEKGDIKAAKSHYLSAIKLKPDNLIAYKNLIHLYETEGELELALDLCEKVISRNIGDKVFLTIKEKLVVKKEHKKKIQSTS
ncbi:tetratricopeptide repeat protein [Aeromonas veronii]|uniref:tetratricopeptide repeat protein n=1 Tax=Aeromonas veronii TaxID=654 RepID=UPI003004B5DA